MKKSIIVLLTMFVAAQAALAVPALRGKYRYTQPDGSVVVLENHGDEHYHWTTDENGNTMEMDRQGYYRRVSISPAEQRARAVRAHAKARKARWSSYDSPFPTNKGDRKILCLLAEFAPEVQNGEEVFSGKYVVEDPQQHFWNMLNESGYNEDGAIGSVRDYYLENSMNQYRPSFDVYGPVQLLHPESYYDENGVDKAILEIYEQLNGVIDISKYDTDGNGDLDMVLFYFPGYNEAEHAPAWTIWPHQSTGNFGDMGGKNLVRYFCTSELRGRSGGNPAAIGTTCHEFAHSLGLPDFYDVGDEGHGGKNNTAELTYTYDLMCYGNYNDNGRRPPYLTSLERNMLGWMEMPPTISSPGNYTLQGIQDNTALRIDGRAEGEFFLMECRKQSGWDSNIPAAGMVVYQVDQSQRVIATGVTAASLWSTSNINSYYGHPCYRIVPAKPLQNSEDYAFPVNDEVREFSPVDWDGNPAGITLTDISYDGASVSFAARMDGGSLLYGYVKDVCGNPLQNATVILSKSAYAFRAPAQMSADLVCTTDEDGYYSFTLETDASPYQVITVMKDGYVSFAENVTVTGRFTHVDFVLMNRGLPSPADLRKYDENLTLTLWSVHTGNVAVGMRYTADELAETGAFGATISQVTFTGWNIDEGQKVYVVIDMGGERALCKEVTELYEPGEDIVVDISDEHVRIPADKDVYIGFGVTDISTSPFLMYGPTAEDHGGCYTVDNFLTSSDWRGLKFTSGYYAFLVSANLTRPSDTDFASYGVSYIKLVDGVPQAMPAAGKTVYSISWTLDGTAVDGPPAVESLSAGAHTYMARLEFYDGTAERVYFDVTKE